MWVVHSISIWSLPGLKGLWWYPPLHIWYWEFVSSFVPPHLVEVYQFIDLSEDPTLDFPHFLCFCLQFHWFLLLSLFPPSLLWVDFALFYLFSGSWDGSSRLLSLFFLWNVHLALLSFLLSQHCFSYIPQICSMDFILTVFCFSLQLFFSAWHIENT